MKRETWAVDNDETIQDLVYQVVKNYNKAYRQNLNYYKIYQYDIRPFIVPECKNIWQEFVTEELIRSLNVEPTAVDTLCTLNQTSDIYFVTAGHPNTMRARDRWLSSHFDFYKSRMLIGCQNKQLLKVNNMIDDYEANLLGGDYRKFLITRPWNNSFNAEAHGIIRIDTISDVLKYVA